MFSRTDRSATMPSNLRSSGHSARPWRIACIGLVIATGWPARRSSPLSAGSRPNSRRASSVRPDPSRPPTPTISPRRRLRSIGRRWPRRPRPRASSRAGPASLRASAWLSWRVAGAPSSRPTIAVISAAGGSSALRYSPTRSPLRNTVTRSLMAYIWSRKWVTNRIARPCSRRRLNSANSCSTSFSSRLEVGSSRISTRAWTLKARAIATICCIATE